MKSINEKQMKTVLDREVPASTPHIRYAKAIDYKDIKCLGFFPRSIRQPEKVLKYIFLQAIL